MGVGVRKGAEAVAHAARIFVKSPKTDDEPQCILKVDFTNAFNSVRRDKMLAIIREKVPEMYNLVWQSYNSTSDLFFDKHTIESCEGVQQGDPLGPLF